MIRITTLAAALAISAAPVVAQDQSGMLAQIPDEMREAAQGYVESRAMQTALDELLSTDTFVAQLRASGLQLDPAETETLAQIVEEEFADVRPELEEAMTFAAAEAFTMDELVALNDFYGSEEGRSIATKMTPFMQAFYQVIGPTLRQTQQQIGQRAQEAMTPPGMGAPGGVAPAD
jgi:uncharacterized protein